MTQPWDPYARDCPSRVVLDRIGDRWTVLLVGALAAGAAAFVVPLWPRRPGRGTDYRAS